MSPNQKLFNTVVTHLRKQGVKAELSSLRDKHQNPCAYRGNNGTQCAFGCLIPDKLYDVSMENELAYQVIAKFDGVRESLDEAFGTGWNLVLIGELQNTHDWTSVDKWEDELESIARFYSLEMPPKP